MIDGQEIGQISTISSRYNGGNIEVYIDGERHLLHVREIGKMVNEFKFKAEMKTKWKHLTVIDKEDICEQCGQLLEECGGHIGNQGEDI